MNGSTKPPIHTVDAPVAHSRSLDRRWVARLSPLRAFVLSALLAGCGSPGPDEDDAATRPVTTATTAPAAVPMPATRPIHIDVAGIPTKFPPVRMELVPADAEVVVRLSSIALPEDVDPGTGVRLSIPTGVAAAHDLDGLEVELRPHRASAIAMVDEGATDAPGDGVLLDGGRRLLEPVAATVLFKGRPPTMTVRIDGTFAEQGGEPVDIYAELSVLVEARDEPAEDDR